MINDCQKQRIWFSSSDLGGPVTLYISLLGIRKSKNLKKINENSDEGNAIIIPGKVLGTGILSHKIILASFSISNSAAKKIKDSGGEIIKFSEMIEKFPTGKGVKIIG